MIKINDLTFRYPQKTQPALADINLEIQPGTLTLLAGASGSGKSTLLRCINGLVPHFSGGAISGKIQVFGSDPIAEGPEALASKVGFVFQEPEAQFVFDIVEDEIAFALENKGVPRKKMHTRVDLIIRQLGLSSIRNKKVHDISGGEMQKVAIASALVTQPPVLILDEPTSQLDPISAAELLQYIVSLKSSLNLTVLISEHRLERMLSFADSIAYLTSEHQLIFGDPQKVIPQMQQLPPVVRIAKELKLSPIPLTIEDFPTLPSWQQPTISSSLPQEQKTPSNPVLVANQMSVRIEEHQILHRVSFQLSQGEILTLLGPNGSGKTTLLRALLGLIPSTGAKYLFGKNLLKMDLAEVIELMAYLPQDPNDLLFAESVHDELRITLKNHQRQVDLSVINQFLIKFGIADKKDQYPRDLSVGERQRTALAAVTVHQPKILLLDEPTRGMDYSAKIALSDLLQDWRNQGTAVLLVTHDIEFAAYLADRVMILEAGEIIFTGSPQAAFTQFPAYQTQTAQLFPGFGWIVPEDVQPAHF